jgi:tRNA(fMet)-specific endonuclease VapC
LTTDQEVAGSSPAGRAHSGSPPDFETVPFDAASARAFGRVAASLRRPGRKPTARAFDALIAASAIANGLPLYTCNAPDFAGIEDLDVVVVPHPDEY